ncbi:hypothetical protein G9A89_012319 [Geosiphon pyriformis]|nr:hypothetical protein G9A89_012319 [Geosiphon pyriformis]
MSYSEDEGVASLEGDGGWSEEETNQNDTHPEDPDAEEDFGGFDQTADAQGEEETQGNEEGEEEEDDEEEEEEEDEEDDDYEEQGRKRGKKRRRDPGNMYVLEEAEVDDEDDEEDEEDELVVSEKFIANDEADEELESAYRQSHHLELERRRQQDEEFDAEAVAAGLKARHGRRRGVRADSDSNLPKIMQLADVNEPHIWMLKCKPGKEREIVCLLMKKSCDSEYSDKPLHLLSVSCRDSLKGYIYVEAWKLAHVQAAVQNINNLYASKITLVPLMERGQVLNVRKRQTEMKPGGWVKVKRGKSAGDLGQIIDVAESGDSARVRLVRRALKDDDKSTNGKRKKPGSSSLGIKRGYIMREIKLTNLIIENVSPTMDEITQFTAAGIDDSREVAGEPTLPSVALRTDFQPGDEVELISGGAHGMIEVIEKDTITFKNSRGTGRITVPPSNLRKKFSVGDQVKVLNGKHKNEEGMIVSISESTVTILCNNTYNEVKVFSKDLKKVSEMAKGITTSSAEYELHDLVKLDAGTVGVIINVEPGQYRVLDQNETIKTADFEQIIHKIETRKMIVTDMKGSQLKEGDIVQELDGDLRQGKLLHLHRFFAFVACRSNTENGGVFVTRWKSLVNKNAKSALPALDRLNPEVLNTMNPNFLQQSTPQFRQWGNRGRGRSGRGSYGGRGRRDDLVDKTVTIVKGPYKGYIGIVKETTDSVARVELHTNCKIVNVEKTKLELRDANGITRPVQLDYGGGSSAYGSPAFTGSSWRADSRTSQWGGSRTPAWNPAMSPNPHLNDGSRTPAIHLSDGSRTPAHHYNEGSRVPAWDLGSRTPAWGADGSETPAWDSGSKTPRWGEGSRTPAYTSDFPGSPMSEAATFTATTPAPDTPGFIAATPGVETPMNYAAPTPGPFSAPTPAPFSAPTPAPFSAPTPAPFSAPTPAPMTPAPMPMTPGNTWNEPDQR